MTAASLGRILLLPGIVSVVATECNMAASRCALLAVAC